MTSVYYCYTLTIDMTLTVAITNNWQLHVPLAVRQIARLEKPGMVTITAKPGGFLVSPKQSKILTLGGIFHKDYLKNPLNIDKIRDEIDYSQA